MKIRLETIETIEYTNPYAKANNEVPKSGREKRRETRNKLRKKLTKN
jgi:hypothetical protein